MILWEDLISEGDAFGLIPCGLAARDSLRTGAALPLSHQDIGNWPFCRHPWPFALPWDDTGKSFTKPFVGSRDKPDGFKPRGLSCGFVKISENLATGSIVFLKDKNRHLRAMIVDEIRPDRTAETP